MARKLNEWFSQGLKDWDISRDAPYFGFEIPDAPGKYFYVWFDAPIGYLGSFRQLCARVGLNFDDFLADGSATELHHFIGKDILYFHTLFWPAVLEGAGMRRPTSVHAHGFVTINGQKMSKSRGTFITARRYLDSFKPEYLRYYFAAKLGPGIDDIDMNLDEFTTRLNSEIVGKLVNIASRCAGLLKSTSDSRLASSLPEPELYEDFTRAGESIAAAFEASDTAAAVREIMGLADRANKYIDLRKPWHLAKNPTPAQCAEVQGICTQALNLFRVMMDLSAAGAARHGAQGAGFFSGSTVDLAEHRDTVAGVESLAVRSAGDAPRCQGRCAADRSRGCPAGCCGERDTRSGGQTRADHRRLRRGRVGRRSRGRRAT